MKMFVLAVMAVIAMMAFAAATLVSVSNSGAALPKSPEENWKFLDRYNGLAYFPCRGERRAHPANPSRNSSSGSVSRARPPSKGGESPPKRRGCDLHLHSGSVAWTQIQRDMRRVRCKSSRGARRLIEGPALEFRSRDRTSSWAPQTTKERSLREGANHSDRVHRADSGCLDLRRRGCGDLSRDHRQPLAADTASARIRRVNIGGDPPPPFDGGRSQLPSPSANRPRRPNRAGAGGLRPSSSGRRGRSCRSG
jgi:hypothetical protein